MGTETTLSLDHLLEWLDSDTTRAGQRYVEFQTELAEYLKGLGAHSSAEALADEVLNRVNARLATPLLSEHFNAAEISDPPGLCLAVRDGGMSNSPSAGRRLWELLPEASRALVTSVAAAGKFERAERARLSGALNSALRRRDFYRAEDFAASLGGAPAALARKIEADLRRGPDRLSQREAEMLNRRLLAASFPAAVKPHLSDSPPEDRLSHCKYFARMVLLEYFRMEGRFDARHAEADDPLNPERLKDEAARDPLGNLIAAEERHVLYCLEECKRKKLSPRDHVVLDMYFTGIKILTPEDEPLPEKEITDVRKSLADRLGVTYEAVRTIAHRSRKIVLDCVVRCVRRGGKF